MMYFRYFGLGRLCAAAGHAVDTFIARGMHFCCCFFPVSDCSLGMKGFGINPGSSVIIGVLSGL